MAENQRLSAVNAAEVETWQEPVEAATAPAKPLTHAQQRIIAAGVMIAQEPPDRTDFLHTVMCQVGLPRSATNTRTFERESGHVSIFIEAGRLYNGRRWVEQPLPYGTIPRLVMVHLSSEAIRTQSRRIEVGDSMRQFLQTLGMGDGGGPRGAYTAVRKQVEALAACRLSIGLQAEGKVVTVDAKPIRKFEAWLHEDGAQQTLWPGVMELSPEFYETLARHAVPLDYRALAALKHSALASTSTLGLPIGCAASPLLAARCSVGRISATSSGRNTPTPRISRRNSAMCSGRCSSSTRRPISRRSTAVFGFTHRPRRSRKRPLVSACVQPRRPMWISQGVSQVMHDESPPRVR